MELRLLGLSSRLAPVTSDSEPSWRSRLGLADAGGSGERLRVVGQGNDSPVFYFIIIIPPRSFSHASSRENNPACLCRGFEEPPMAFLSARALFPMNKAQDNASLCSEDRLFVSRSQEGISS